MTLSKETLSDYKEKYAKAEQLVEEDSKQDPETEPFRSHYAARELLIQIQNNLKNSLSSVASAEADDAEAADRRTLTHLLGYIYKDTGRICVWTEELAAGEQYLNKCLDLLRAERLQPACVNAYLGALNQIGMLWANRQNAAEAQRHLLEAQQLYEDFRASGERALTIYDIFAAPEADEPLEVSEKGSLQLEKMHTLTLYYLAQVVGQLGDMHASATYCHTTLKRQLEFEDYEPIDWALNAATLSQYFFNHGRNTDSRHHLAAAQSMLDQHERTMYDGCASADARAAVLETFHHRSSDVMRCWAKYGLNLLVESRDRLMEDREKQVAGEAVESPTHTAALCRFESLQLDEYERCITDQYVLMFDDAKPVFLAVQQWLNRAKEYYAPETEASEYAKIVQDLANAYKYLAFFECDESNQCKMHKRRADLLEELLELLNETYYMSVCRELWYELGLTYACMLDIKQELADQERRRTGAPNPAALNKINGLCHKSITRFQAFVASYSDKQTLKLKAGLADDELEPILFAYFECGRLYYKLTTPDRAQQIANTQQSLRYYQLLVDGCEANKTHEKRLKAEYGVCKEMTELLPLKIKKLQEQTM